MPVSVLFRNTDDRAATGRAREPKFFADLALDQVVAAIISGRDEYDLRPFFHMPLSDLDEVWFRHEVMRDLEDQRLFADVTSFATAMRTTRQRLAFAESMSHRRQKERWLLDAADSYCKGVIRLGQALDSEACASRGLQAMRTHVERCVGSTHFTAFRERTLKLKADLASIRYCLVIDGLLVQGKRYEGEPDYAEEVGETFMSFRRDGGREFGFSLGDEGRLNPVEERVLALVAHLHPDVFLDLEAYCVEYREFRDPDVLAFDREIQFYVACLERFRLLRSKGLTFCFPRLSDEAGVSIGQGFDLALAGNLLGEALPVPNDIHLDGRERILVVTGPNQGGKTTFARMFGQIHYLASLGCQVPGENVRLRLPDGIYTHFERRERVADLRGKLQDDLLRMLAILEQATDRSVIVINEIFASTTFHDAADLSRKISDIITARDALCMWVTFIDELASMGGKTVSMAGDTDPNSPDRRTYRFVRKPADGRAHALQLARKHRLSSDQIAQRLGA